MKGRFALTALSLALLAGGATAYAQPGDGPPHPPRYEELDTNGDGSVSLEEFAAPAEEHFTELDADGDGVISSDEFLAHVEEHFAKIDADGNGAITQAELEAGRPRHGRGGGGRGEQ